METFDVAIAGGGLIGAAIALELSQTGLQVGIFEHEQPGEGASWAGAGILSPAPENSAMIATVAIGRASLERYPEFVAVVEEISGENVGYRAKGTLGLLFSGHAQAELSTIIALHHGLGLKAEPLNADDARAMEPVLSDEIEAAVFRPDEASVDNRALTKATLNAAKQCGAKLFAGKRVTGICKNHGRCTGLMVGDEKVESGWTVIAAGCRSGEISGVSRYAPVRPAKGQMIALRRDAVRIERVLWSDKVYLVPRNDGRILVGATVEYVGFEKTVTAGAVEALLRGAIDLAPELANAQIQETWAGLRPDSPDHLPIIGATDVEGLLVATGHFRSGILLAPITARLIREWITRQSVALDWERFSPLRFVELGKATTQ
jgi:glycine oxidase